MRAFIFTLSLFTLTATQNITVSEVLATCPEWCGDPYDKIDIWTDDAKKWQCETPSIDGEYCAATVTVKCSREEHLGGDLYLMMFRDSPDKIGVNPDFITKGNGTEYSTTLTCRNGIWTMPNKKTRITHVLCDQYLHTRFVKAHRRRKTSPSPVQSTTPATPSPESNLLVLGASQDGKAEVKAEVTDPNISEGSGQSA